MPRINKDDPLFRVLTDFDVGIGEATGKPKIVKVVLDEMRQYLSVTYPTEKRACVERVRRSVWDLDTDPQGQNTHIRLKAAPTMTNDINKIKGLIFGYEEKEVYHNTEGKFLASVIRAGNSSYRHSPVDGVKPMGSSQGNGSGPTVFRAGGNAWSSGIKPNYVSKRNRLMQWKQKIQKKTDG